MEGEWRGCRGTPGGQGWQHPRGGVGQSGAQQGGAPATCLRGRPGVPAAGPPREEEDRSRLPGSLEEARDHALPAWQGTQGGCWGLVTARTRGKSREEVWRARAAWALQAGQGRVTQRPAALGRGGGFLLSSRGCLGPWGRPGWKPGGGGLLLSASAEDSRAHPQPPGRVEQRLGLGWGWGWGRVKSPGWCREPTARKAGGAEWGRSLCDLRATLTGPCTAAAQLPACPSGGSPGGGGNWDREPGRGPHA